MSLPIYDTDLLQNQTFTLSLSLLNDDGVTPLDITNWSFTGSVKTNFTDIVPLTFFTMSVTPYATGSIHAVLSAEQTWLFTNARYYYDIIGNTSTSSTIRLLQGKIITRFGVTEP